MFYVDNFRDDMIRGGDGGDGGGVGGGKGRERESG